MKNFFDIATPEEVREHFPTTVTVAGRLAQLRDDFERDPDRNWGYLASMYAMRNDEAQANYCLSQMKDEGHRLDVSTSIYELR